MNILIELVFGDWNSRVIKTNRTKDEIEKAYKDATEMLGFSFIDTVGHDDWIAEINLAELQANGVDLSFLSRKIEVLQDTQLTEDEYVQIYLGICKLGDPTLIYSMPEISIIDIGGYGF